MECFFVPQLATIGNRSRKTDEVVYPRSDGAYVLHMARTTSLVVFEGVLLIILGVAAIALPLAATIAVTFLVGLILLIAGGFRTYSAVANHHSGWGWGVAIGLIGVATGLLVVLDPLAGEVAITLIIGVFFFVEGVVNLVSAIGYRRSVSVRGLLVIQGLLGLLIGVLIAVEWPVSADWFLGMLVGINLVFAGTSVVAFARALGKAKE
jgi:uncharacterized membrane protein HdeD (DUF308 family)